LTEAYQSIKAASANLVDSLRKEVLKQKTKKNQDLIELEEPIQITQR
jgi:hypothetical protein